MWFQHLFFQYRFYCFSVVVTTKRCIYELCEPQMSLGGMHPSLGKEITLGGAFPKYGGSTRNSKMILEMANSLYNQYWSQGLLCRVGPSFPSIPLGMAASQGFFLCLPHSKFRWEKNLMILKRNQILPLTSSHKPTCHTTRSDFVYVFVSYVERVL